MADASPTPIVETAPEEWRDVRSYEGVYQVSNHGRVRRLTKPVSLGGGPLDEPLMLRPWRMKIGYHQVTLAVGQRKRKEYVHILVADAFLGPRPPGHYVAHLDGNSGNSTLANLAYVTPTENNAHKRVHGTHRIDAGPNASNARLTAEQVRQMRALRARHGPRKLPMRELGRMFGVSREAAYAVCRRLTYRNVD